MTTRDAIRAALYTAAFTFVATFATTALGWFQDLAAWASDETNAIVFPDPRVLVKAVVSAVAAAFAGLLNFLWRYAQARGVIGGQAPKYSQSK